MPQHFSLSVFFLFALVKKIHRPDSEEVLSLSLSLSFSLPIPFFAIFRARGTIWQKEKIGRRHKNNPGIWQRPSGRHDMHGVARLIILDTYFVKLFPVYCVLHPTT
jgi:hypothetical protein